jgi:adenylate kinase family enzyme
MRLYEFKTLDEGLYDQNIFKAVFMAGAPGAGKSTVANKIFASSGLRPLNVDAFWQLYKSKGKEGDYEHYWALYKHQEKNYLDGRLGLLIDGTARNPEIMAQVKTRLEKIGYDCAMIFVNTSLETSLDRTVRRAQTPGKDMGRTVDTDFVTKSWQQVQNGLGKLQTLFGQHFYIVDNNQGEPNVSYVDKAMRNWLNQTPRRPAAVEWIKHQKELKAK